MEEDLRIRPMTAWARRAEAVSSPKINLTYGVVPLRSAFSSPLLLSLRLRLVRHPQFFLIDDCPADASNPFRRENA